MRFLILCLAVPFLACAPGASTTTGSSSSSSASSSSGGGGSASVPVNLIGLNVAPGSLNPAFSPDVTSYRVPVPGDTARIAVTPTTQDSGAALRVNNVASESGAPSAVNLTPGLNPITVVVSSRDGNARTYTVVVDVAVSTEPSVLVVSPTAGAVSIPVGTAVDVTFSEAMAASTITESSFTVSASGALVSGAATYDVTTQTARFTPANALQADTLYTVTINAEAVDEDDGLPIANAPYTWTFRTASTTAPTGCLSNPDCAEPAAICDQVQQQCVQCLQASDCSAVMPGTVCSLGACVCPGDAELAWCGRLAQCVDLQTATQNCGQCGHACFGQCTLGQCVDPWEPTPTTGAPSARGFHIAIATGSRMVVWGGATSAGNTSTGAYLDVNTREWSPTSLANVPTPRARATAVLVGTKVVVWGGESEDGAVGTGGILDVATNRWTAISQVNAPSPRHGHSMVYAGAPVSRVIVWGGSSGSGYLNNGAALDVTTNQWTALPVGPLRARMEHSAVWSGSSMMVWGGYANTGSESVHVNDGASYDPVVATWTMLASNSAPRPRLRHQALWVDSGASSGMMVLGGSGVSTFFGDGGLYSGTSWTPVSDFFGVDARAFATAVFIPPWVLSWGGQNYSGQFDDDGVVYDTRQTPWTVARLPTAPSARAHHTAVAVDGRMVIWGGRDSTGYLGTGAWLNPAALP